MIPMGFQLCISGIQMDTITLPNSTSWEILSGFQSFWFYTKLASSVSKLICIDKDLEIRRSLTDSLLRYLLYVDTY